MSVEDGISAYICMKNTENEFTLVNAYTSIEKMNYYMYGQDGEGNTIEGTCNEEGTQCSIPVELWCEFDVKCTDNNQIMKCFDDDSYLTYYTYNCSGEEYNTTNQVCVVVEGNTACYDTCTNEGEIVGNCVEKDIMLYYAVTKVCTMGGDENLYYVEDEERCFHECVMNEPSWASYPHSLN